MTPLDIALVHLKTYPEDYLFPLAKLSKFPPLLKKNLSDNCSNDPKQLVAWDNGKTPEGRSMKGCNWGIALRRSRLIVADVDVSKGKPGRETYDLLDMLWTWPSTQRVRSPSGGYHCLYRGQQVMKVNGFGPAVDSPNYVVCPGMPVKDGGRYRYINALPRAEAPTWFYKLLARKEHLQVSNAAEVVVEYDQAHNIATAIDYLLHDAPLAVEGEGGEFRTMKTAMALRDLGISEEYALGLMLEHYNERCSGPWEYDELRQKVRNGFAYASMHTIGGLTAEADFAGQPIEPITQLERARARRHSIGSKSNVG